VIKINTLGIITEYNPFHNGHLFHLKKAKEISNSDAVVCIMNGNFVQRGRPAIIDKFARTRMAIENGVDLVIELPLIYGIRSAEFFAYGSIQLLEKMGIIDSIVFGSEIGEIKVIDYLARILVEEPQEFRYTLKKQLNQGISFPKARENALYNYIANFPNNEDININKLIETLSEPNNILGIEYLKVLHNINSSINALTIKRSHKNYHSNKLNNKMASATAIRNEIYNNKNLNIIKELIPERSFKILNDELLRGKGPTNIEYMGIMILSILRQMEINELREFAEIDNGLEYRINEAAANSGTLDQLIQNIKSKNLTWTRIQRNLLHILFNIKAKDFDFLDITGPHYLRVLGFNNKGKILLKKIKENSSLPIITQVKDYLNNIDTYSNNPVIKSLSYDIIASDIFSLLFPCPDKRISHLDFTNPLIVYNN
jgi:predicted nucleotidyltransferase